MPANPSPAPLPTLTVPLAPDEIVERLRTASKRGRLAGFAAPHPGGLFKAEAFASPFESELIATAQDAPGGRALAFRVRMLPRLPVIFAAVCIFTVWPGVWFTESLLQTYWPWLPQQVPTAWWYLPLSILPLPFAWRSWMRKSRRESDASAREQIAKIAAELGVPAPNA